MHYESKKIIVRSLRALFEHIQRVHQIFLLARKKRTELNAIFISFRPADLLRIPFCSPAVPVIFQLALFYIPISM